MKTIYHIHVESDETGELEALFDEFEKVLDWWFANDATWRTEYFSGAMAKLGIEVKKPVQAARERMSKKLIKVATA